MEQSIIYVQNTKGQPLMPTRRQNKVWYWLRKGLARMVSREPFTIQLCFETAEYRQSVTVGVDTGSKDVGVAATTNGAVVYQAEVHLRLDITDKIASPYQFGKNIREGSDLEKMPVISYFKLSQTHFPFVRKGRIG